MKRLYLITLVIITIYTSIVTGCAVKTVATKNVDQELEESPKDLSMEKLPKKLAVDKKIIKEQTIKPTGQKSLPDKKMPSFILEETLTSEKNINKNSEPNIDNIDLMQAQKATSSKEESNPFFDPNAEDKINKNNDKKFISSEQLNDIYFAFDQHKIDKSAKEILLKNAEWLKLNPFLKIKLAGHCDERGTNNYNIALGERRALYVKKQLAFLGISKNRLFPISFGEEKPTCWEGEEKCWSKNRRVQFLIISD